MQFCHICNKYIDTDLDAEHEERHHEDDMEEIAEDERCHACGRPIGSGNCYYCKMD